MSQKPPPNQFIKTSINGTKHTLLVSSAKGGVGKSTSALNIALSLIQKSSMVFVFPCKTTFIVAKIPIITDKLLYKS